MSLIESRVQGVIDASRGAIKCRIPQRLTGRQRIPVTRPRIPNTVNATKSKMDDMPALYSRFGVKTTSRIRHDEPLRPKSASRVKEDACSRQRHPAPRPTRPEQNTIAPKRQGKFYVPKIVAGLPDQETIKKHEELELCLSEHSNQTQTCTELNEQESITSWSDKVMGLKINWQNKIVQFEKMKNELNERQREMMELYAKMQVTHKKMWTLGQKVELPDADDLHIMNVAKLTPVQLLQLCAKSRYIEDKTQETQDLAKIPVTLNVNKMYDLPAKLVDTCEDTLSKMKEIIDWFESIRTVDKRISMHNLTKKLREFTKDNEILNCSLEKAKNEYHKELNNIVDIVRKCVNETMALHLRTEELTSALSELNSQNDDLRKQIHNANHHQLQDNKYRNEELEKELKEEKSKKIMMRDRLSRAEGQVKITAERIAQLEATLEQNKSQNRTLERTIQQLQDQNHKLQADFDQEVNKLTESFKVNTVHLEEITNSRKKIQSEKEELEKQLANLKEQHKNLKQEMNVKVLDSDKKYHEVIKNTKNLEEKVASLCAQLSESELRNKDLHKQLQDTELQLSNLRNCQLELEASRRDLSLANTKIEDYKNRLKKQSEAIKEIERSFKETLELEESHKRDLNNKDEYIVELEKKQLLLEKQLQESESKLISYEEQLSTLKHHITKLREDFGDFENLNELRQMMDKQRAKLLETTRQNVELAEAVQNKSTELESHLDNFAEYERLLEQRSGVIKILTEKEEEQTNIIKILRNNLEMRTQADTDLNQQLLEKNAEINSLLTTSETRKQQLSELEKITLTLEDQTNKANVQISELEKIILSLEDESQKNCTERRKLQEKILILENKVQEFEICQMDNKRILDGPKDNLDNLIKVLENELGMKPFDFQISAKDPKRKTFGNRNVSSKIECRNGQTPLYHSESETMPTKIVMGNYVKKTYTPTNKEQPKSDRLYRKKVISNRSPHEWESLESEVSTNIYDSTPVNKNHSHRLVVEQPKENYLRFLVSNQLREDKKMFKFAGHRL